MCSSPIFLFLAARDSSSFRQARSNCACSHSSRKRAAVEEFGEDFLGFGHVVEPLDEVGAREVVVEVKVEFFAYVLGEAGDFAGSGGVHGRVFSVQFQVFSWEKRRSVV
jgi:hypothetical protein